MTRQWLLLLLSLFSAASHTIAFKVGEAGLEALATDELGLDLEWPELEHELDSQTQALIEWHTDNLVFFLEKLVPLNEQLMNETVAPQLKEFVTRIAALYKAENPYHNFEHATHVTQAIRELLLVSTSSSRPMQTIRGDPLIVFSLVFSALVHDVAHEGVPNSQLIAEESPLAVRYQNQSIAERNSIDIALQLWSQFPVLRQLIEPYRADWEYLVSKAIIATDIASSSLRSDRQARWQAVFGETQAQAQPEQSETELLPNKNNNKKEYYLDAPTLIALEHCMQVADVAHTMQDGTTNHLWNERLLAEWRHAYRKGRSEKDPLDGWYMGELGFFDFYVLPLARKWERCCGLNTSTTSADDSNKTRLWFGSTSLLEEAERNREEWIEVGHEIVAELEEKYK